jgi:hypothetical protein
MWRQVGFPQQLVSLGLGDAGELQGDTKLAVQAVSLTWTMASAGPRTCIVIVRYGRNYSTSWS